MITLIRPLFSLNSPPTHTHTTHSNSFILVSNIIDCCQSSYPHLSIFLNATNVQSSKKKCKIKKKLKRNGGGIDYSLPDFCMISPAPLKQHKSEQITPFANERGKWMEYLSRLKRKPVLRFNLCLLGDPRSPAPRGEGDDNNPLLAAASMLVSRRRPHRRRLTSTLSN